MAVKRKTVDGRDIQRYGQSLPPDFARSLLALHQRRDPMVEYIVTAAVDKGWTMAAFAPILQCTRQRIYQLVMSVHNGTQGRLPLWRVRAQLPPIPDPPLKPQPVQKAPCYEIPEDQAQQLREQYEVARAVNGAVTTDDPRRAITEQFTKTLADLLYDKHVSAGRLAAVIGCKPNTIYFRLRRHGYANLPPSQLPYRGHARWEKPKGDGADGPMPCLSA